MWLWGFVLVVIVLGCSSPPKLPADLAADTEFACARGDAAAWTQIVFRTDAWQDLARRADAGEAQAFDRIADHMQNQLNAGDSRCSSERIATLRATARRLRAQPVGSARGSDKGDSPPQAEPAEPDSGKAESPEAEVAMSDPPSADVSPDAGQGTAAHEAEKQPPSGQKVPRVRVGDGRFAVYRRVLRSGQARFRRCYEGALARREEPKATAIEFGIAADGHVDRTSFERGTTFFDGCMDAALKSLRFPEDTGRVTIRYPLAELPK